MTSTRNYMRVRDKRIKEAKARYHRLGYKTTRAPKAVRDVAEGLGVTPNQARAIMGLPYKVRRKIVNGKRQTLKSAIYDIESVADLYRHRNRSPSTGAAKPCYSAADEARKRQQKCPIATVQT